MKFIVTAAFATVLLASPAVAQTVEVEITNITHGIYFTPFLAATHPEDRHLFQVGTAASPNLQAMAEGGNISGLVDDLNTIEADVVADPASGALAPGAKTTASFPKSGQNTHLSIVGMLLPTNDGFVGLDSLKIPNATGVYTYYLDAYDAGTEVNDEIVNGGGAPNIPGIPVDPGGANGSGGSGVTTEESNTLIHIHRGVLGDMDDSGGKSDLDATVHRWLNPVVKIVIAVN